MRSALLNMQCMGNSQKKNSEHSCIGSVNYTDVFIVFLHIFAQHAVHDKFEQCIQNMS